MSEIKNENLNSASTWTTFKQNLIYIVMFLALISGIVYTIVNKEEKVEDSTTQSKLPIFLSIFLVVLMFFIYMIFSSKNFEQEKKLEQPIQKMFTKRMTKEEYERTTKDATFREMEKLKNNPKFRQMINEKGNDPKNWVWQTREKEKKTVWRERENQNYSDEEDDHLSQISISDD